MGSVQNPKLPAAQHSARYLGGAILCALVNNVILIAGHAAGLADFTSVVICWFAGGTTGYLWHHRITFRVAPSRAGYLRFLAGSALGIPLSYLALALFHQWLDWEMWLAAPATTIAMFAYSYLSARIALLWRRR